MGTVCLQTRDLPWQAHPEAVALKMKQLLELSGEGITVRRHRIPPTGIPEHSHPRRHIIWVISGQGRLCVQDLGELELRPGAFVYVPSGVSHRFYGLAREMEVFTVSMPAAKGG